MGSLLRPIRHSRVVLGCLGIPHVRFVNYHLIGRVISKSPELPKPNFLSFFWSKMEWVVTQSQWNLLAFLQDVLFKNSLISFSKSKPWHPLQCPWRGVCGLTLLVCSLSPTPLYILVNVLRYQRYQTWHSRRTYIIYYTPFRFHLEEKCLNFIWTQSKSELNWKFDKCLR